LLELLPKTDERLRHRFLGQANGSNRERLRPLALGAQMRAKKITPNANIIVNENQHLSSRGFRASVASRRSFDPFQPQQEARGTLRFCTKANWRCRAVIHNDYLVLIGREILRFQTLQSFDQALLPVPRWDNHADL